MDKPFTGFLSSWATPTGVALLLGGIVWGVQLNVATMNLNAGVVTLTERVAAVEKESEIIGDNLLRTTIVLEAMEIRMIKALEHVENHNKESEDWKRRIVILEEMLRRHDEMAKP